MYRQPTTCLIPGLSTLIDEMLTNQRPHELSQAARTDLDALRDTILCGIWNAGEVPQDRREKWVSRLALGAVRDTAGRFLGADARGR